MKKLTKVNEDKDFGTAVEYEDGYTFDKETKALMARQWAGEETAADRPA
jgi:hypothetical protein